MNPLPQWLGSDGWGHVIRALLHTLWVGGLLALVLWFRFKRTANPFIRYRWCLLALVGTLLGGLVAWGILARKPVIAPESIGAARAIESENPIQPAIRMASSFEQPPGPVVAAATQAPGNRWTPWLALAWMSGAVIMLGRAARGVAQAEKLRRATRPLEDGNVLRLIREARNQLGMARRFRVAVTDRLTSPAVVGVLVPTLVLPLSLLTSVPAGQLQFVLLHELAHIRRGDYLANLFQFLVESLLFFNPAVWWISRQTRQEREACCDALAIRSAGDRVEYARALARVAEWSLESLPGPAFGFADEHRPSALKDRIQRLLVPGYRPAPRLTWRALLGSLAAGGLLLMLSALGTQWAVSAAAKLLTPRQRIERIETAMRNMGQLPPDPANERDEYAGVEVRVRTEDDSPLPRGTVGIFHSRRARSSSSIAASPRREGLFTARVPLGQVYFSVLADGYAPAFLGPLSLLTTNPENSLELVLTNGFDASIQAVDADSGEGIPDASLACQFWTPPGGSSIGNPRRVTTGSNGNAPVPHCASLPLRVTMDKPGYERTEARFDRVDAGAILRVSARKSLPTSGLITEKETGRPIPDASLFMLRAEGAAGVAGGDPKHTGPPLATTDGQGRFQIDVLPRSGRYWLLARAPGCADAIVNEVHAGETNLQVQLGPELRVRGRITGNLGSLQERNGEAILAYANDYEAGDHRLGTSASTVVNVEDGVGHFEFVSPIAGLVKLTAGGRVFERQITRSIEDWHIDLASLPEAGKTRTVTLHFEHPSGVPPKGTVTVHLPGPEQHTTIVNEPQTTGNVATVSSRQFSWHMLYLKDMEIVDGAVSFQAPVGSQFSFEPGRIVGYWFPPQQGITVSNEGPAILRVPVIPAGAIYAQARQVDGKLAANVSFSVKQIKRSPLVKDGWPAVPNSDSWSADGPPRQYVATPLPLGGSYRIIAWQGDNFAVSEPIELTEAAPDRRIELRFEKGAEIEGRVLSPDGHPIAGAHTQLSWNHEGSGFSLASCTTDERGRFVFGDCNPRLGQYSITVRRPGMQTESMSVRRVGSPLTIHLRPGLKLSGRAAHGGSGRAIVDAEIRALPENGQLPTETTRTDEQGRFEFSTLADGGYRIIIDSCRSESGWPLVQAHGSSVGVLKGIPFENASVKLGPVVAK